jgi:hypothetical protein
LTNFEVSITSGREKGRSGANDGLVDFMNVPSASDFQIGIHLGFVEPDMRISLLFQIMSRNSLEKGLSQQLKMLSLIA